MKIKICISVSLGTQKDVNHQCMSLVHAVKSDLQNILPC